MPISFKRKFNGAYKQQNQNTQQQNNNQQNQNTQTQNNQIQNTQTNNQTQNKEWSEKELLRNIYFILRDIRDDIRSIRRNTYFTDKEHNTFTSIAELLNSIDKKIE
jgi:peptide subunit release factor RF-3